MQFRYRKSSLFYDFVSFVYLFDIEHYLRDNELVHRALCHDLIGDFSVSSVYMIDSCDN